MTDTGAIVMRSTKERFRVSMLIRVIIILVGLVYALLYHIGKVPEELNAAIVVTLLLFLAEQFVEVGHKLREIPSLTWEKKLHFPGISILPDVLSNATTEISNSLKVDAEKSSFTVSNPYLAIKSYTDFWSHLTARQERNGEGKPTLVQINV
jgi:hypothetical protein